MNSINIELMKCESRCFYFNDLTILIYKHFLNFKYIFLFFSLFNFSILSREATIKERFSWFCVIPVNSIAVYIYATISNFAYLQHTNFRVYLFLQAKKKSYFRCTTISECKLLKSLSL